MEVAIGYSSTAWLLLFKSYIFPFQQSWSKIKHVSFIGFFLKPSNKPDICFIYRPVWRTVTVQQAECCMGGWKNNLRSKQRLVCSENIAVHPVLTTLKLGLCHVISIVSIFGCCVTKHHYVMSKISSVFCSQSPINPVFLSIWYCFPDSMGQNKNRSLIFITLTPPRDVR